jgi:hypothetical protein
MVVQKSLGVREVLAMALAPNKKVRAYLRIIHTVYVMVCVYIR